MRYFGPILYTLAIAAMTFLNFYRFIYEGPNKQLVYDGADCIAWSIMLGYFFIVRKYTNPLINALMIFNSGGCLVWFIKIFFADTTQKYPVDWYIGGAFAVISVGVFILEIATNKRPNLWTNQSRSTPMEE